MKGFLFRFTAIVIIATTFATAGFAQHEKEVVIEIAKMQQPGYQGEYQLPCKLMNTTLKDELDKAGLGRGKKYKGYRKYEGVNLPAISENKVDIYTKVKGNKKGATVVMAVSTGYDNFISMQKDAGVATKTINFLNKLYDDAVAYQAAIDLQEQREAYEKAEKKRKEAAEKQARAAKEQEEARKKAEAERLRLENLKGQNSAK